MPTTPLTKTITQTEATIDSLKLAHRWLFKVLEGLYEEQWVIMMFEYGYHYAECLAICYPGKEDVILNALIKAAPDPGEEHNWFWMWWKVKWMMDDWHYISNKVYQQPVTYSEYKVYMRHDQKLQLDLLDILHSKKVSI
jgi:hypothetical protein